MRERSSEGTKGRVGPGVTRCPEKKSRSCRMLERPLRNPRLYEIKIADLTEVSHGVSLCEIFFFSRIPGRHSGGCCRICTFESDKQRAMCYKNEILHRE